MKKNQNGVSMVSLVITIIVIIILAAVAFTGSQETISRAGFSGFVTDIDSVRTAFITEGVTNLMGEQEAKNNTVSAAQAYNYLAKAGDSDDDWLTKGQASAIQCTEIKASEAPNTIGITLPVRTVNTLNRTKVPMTYFVTNKGDIFVWPPYFKSDDGLYYVNDTVTLPASYNEDSKVYGVDVTFQINGVSVTVKNGTNTNTITATTSSGDVAAMAGVYYQDSTSTNPVGLQ